ncbi:MAG: glycosyltransferase family 4 protein [Ignavibacteria bacterium]|nr:glycosyltransferase family 4 protein [Ignavibacteria bacterium]
MLNILYVTGKLNFTDGVTSHLYYLLKELSKNPELNIYLICTGGDSVRRFEDTGLEIIKNVNFDHDKRSIINFTASVKYLTGFLRERKINIVHSHNHYAANISYYASRFSNAGTVQTLHGLIPDTGFLSHFKAEKIITVNKHSLEYLINHKLFRKENIFFINHGYDFSSEKTKSEYRRILCASRLIQEKGADVFIRAAEIIKRSGKDKLEFIIAGNGEYENELKKLDSDLNAGVHFKGTIKNLPVFMSGTDIFVMPTRSKSEGFPMTLVEAAFSGNFLIISDTVPCKNIFEDKKDGYVFKTDDHKDLARKILWVIDNPEKSEIISENFSAKAKKIFDLKISAVKHIKVYRECLRRI